MHFQRILLTVLILNDKQNRLELFNRNIAIFIVLFKNMSIPLVATVLNNGW